jgi:uncharacterized protein
MAKILFWIVVVFAVMFALRLYNARKAREKATDAGNAERKRQLLEGDPMVRCARCGVFLPKAEATAVSTGYVCADPACARRG